jgi:iron uptake system component EfeO
VHTPSTRRRNIRFGVVAVTVGVTVALSGCAKEEAPSAGPGTIEVKLTDGGCEPIPNSVPAGEVAFIVTNSGTAKVTEAELKSENLRNILGERENLTAGLEGTFKLNLREGNYKVVCPGAKQDTWNFTVAKGQVVKDWRDNPDLVAAVAGYSTYIEEQTAQLATVTKAFTDAVRAGDVDRAKDLYGLARVPYERIEPVAESFGDLDPEIDGRADDGVAPTDLTGFHRLEYALWVEGSLDGMAPIADKLDADVAKLHDLVKEKSGTYVPDEVTNGAKELLDEVLVSKITGEEERYSHTDLIDFQANLDGSLKAIDLVRPALAKSAPDLLAKIDTKAKAVQAALDTFKADPGHANTGFIEWGYEQDSDSAISDAQRRVLADAVKPLVELLAEVPVKVTL